MQSVDVVMKLFRVMSEEEKKQTILQIGDVCEAEGLTAKWGRRPAVAATAASVKRRSGGGRACWIKHVDGTDASAKGMDKLHGSWAKEGEFTDGLVYLVGVKGEPKKYYVCRGSRASKMTVQLWGGKEFKEIEGLACVAVCDTFNDVVTEIAHLL